MRGLILIKAKRKQEPPILEGFCGVSILIERKQGEKRRVFLSLKLTQHTFSLCSFPYFLASFYSIEK